MDSWTGELVWRVFLPDMVPLGAAGGSSAERRRLLLFVQRTTAHFPHQPQCVVLGKHRVSKCVRAAHRGSSFSKRWRCVLEHTASMCDTDLDWEFLLPATGDGSGDDARVPPDQWRPH